MIGATVGALFGFGMYLILRQIYSLIEWLRRRLQSRPYPLELAIGFMGLVVAEYFWGNWIISLSGFGLAFLAAQFWTPYSQRQKHQIRIFRESLQLPELVDLLSISLTAGLSLPNAFAQTLPRVSNLLQAFWLPLLDTETDLTFFTRLELVYRLNPDAASGLLANQLLVAAERGTAMLPVLEAFATDLRSRNQRVLLERAAKKDVWMMVPVVFGILPAVTAVAIYPALISLSNI